MRTLLLILSSLTLAWFYYAQPKIHTAYEAGATAGWESAAREFGAVGCGHGGGGGAPW